MIGNQPVNIHPVAYWALAVVLMVALLFLLLTASAYTVWFERVALGRMQRRPGPNRVGPFGLMQLVKRQHAD